MSWRKRNFFRRKRNSPDLGECKSTSAVRYVHLWRSLTANSKNIITGNFAVYPLNLQSDQPLKLF